MEIWAERTTPAEEIQTAKKYSANLMEILTKPDVPVEDIQIAICHDLTEWMKTQRIWNPVYDIRGMCTKEFMMREVY